MGRATGSSVGARVVGFRELGMLVDGDVLGIGVGEVDCA